MRRSQLDKRELSVPKTHCSAVNLLDLVGTLQQQEQQHDSTACQVESMLKQLSLCKQYYAQVSNDTVRVSGLDVVQYAKHWLEHFQNMHKHLDDAAVLKHWTNRIQHKAGVARSKLKQVTSCSITSPCYSITTTTLYKDAHCDSQKHLR
jgi:hypothetical protein